MTVIPARANWRYTHGIRFNDKGATVNRGQHACLTLVVALLAAAPGSAHHSPAEYDRSELVEFEGEARSVSWKNPHVIVELAITEQDGQERIWSLEAAAVSNQRRRGVTEGLLLAGDQVRVAGYRSTRRPGHLLLEHVLLPNGTELLVGSARESRWSEDVLGGNVAALRPSNAPAGAKPTGIFRVWTRAGGYWPWFFREADEFELTESAAAKAAEFDPFEDNPLLDCTPPGMPALMGNPYPMQFIDRGDTIEVRFEEFDVVRTIHMNDTRNAATVLRSPLGYSVGRWEGDSLVVSTSRINWPHFGRVGIPQSESIEVQERFTVVDAADRLNYELEMRDPEVFAGTVTWEAHYEWRPGESVGVYACTVEE
jgi:hypothetical protein